MIPGSSTTIRPVTSTAKLAGWTAPQICLAAFALAWVSMAIFHEMNIGGEWDPVSIVTWGWLFLWVAALSAAYLLSGAGRGAPRQVGRQMRIPVRIDRWIIAFCGIVAVGIGLFVFDFAILRGYGFTTAAAAIRTEEVNAALSGTARSSAFSGVGRLLIPAFLPTTMIAVLYWRHLKTPTRLIFLATAATTVLQQLLFEGGRFFIASTAVTVVTAYLIFPPVDPHRRVARKRKIPFIRLALLAMVMLSFFSYVFITRALERGDYFATAYLQLASSFDVTPNYSQLDLFEGPFGGLWFSICMLWLYITQGVNELDLLLQQPYLEHAHGLYQMPHIGQAVMMATGIDIRYDVLANLPTYGSYATFYGHSYVDFGNGGSIVLALIIGYFSGKSIDSFWRGEIRPLSLIGPVMFTLCIFSPIISLVPTIWPAIAWSLVAGVALRTRSA
ncbi:O-antigen polymerase [Sphingopyxis sp.]|uniref:O-antigen polymerase n=1 Tax=Sphingopyxis sp. TaxID=1908224 RepID=UPI002FCBABA1